MGKGYFRTVPCMEQSTPSPHNPQENPGTALVWSTTKGGPGRQIIDEWARLAYRPAVLRRVNSWEFMPHSVDNLDQLLELCGFGKAIDDAAGDNMLWHLVRLAEKDELAARVVLHRVMPALLAIGRRRGKIMKGGTNVAMTELLSSAWMVIREFPHERRRAKIASNIVRDAEYYAFVRERRLVRVDERQVEDRVLAWLFDANRPGMNEMTLDEVLQVAVDRGVERRHIELLSKLGSGQHGEEIAVEWGVSSRTVRNYRRLAIDAVREVLVQCR